jgi:aconitase B
MKEDTFAVKKKTNKRALKVFDSMEEAEWFMKQKSLGDDHIIETRKGAATRCEQDWCRVSNWCDQYARAANE